MSAFKDLIKADIEKIFLSCNDFAEKHLIDGIEMDVLIDNNELMQRQTLLNIHKDGLYAGQILIYIKASQYGKKPTIGKLLVLDKKFFYRVIDCIEEDGIFAITLDSNMS